jgi:hypothetical protein
MEWKTVHENALRVAGTINRCEKELVEILIRAEELQIYRRFELTGLYSYCTNILKLSDSQASAAVRVSRKSVSVPQLKAAIDKGELTLSRAKKIASVITSDNHAGWIEKAQTLSTFNLECLIAQVAPREAIPDRVRAVAEDCLELRCSVDAETSALLNEARDLVSRKLGKSAGIGDALRLALLAYVERHDPIRRAQRLKARRECKAKALLGTMSPVALADLNSIQQNKSAPARPIKVPEGVNRPTRPALDRGRRSAIPAAIRHAVNLRDGGQCTHMHAELGRCLNRRWTEAHHLKPVSLGGAHATENLTTLCSAHHRDLHQGAKNSTKCPRGQFESERSKRKTKNPSEAPSM